MSRQTATRFPRVTRGSLRLTLAWSATRALLVLTLVGAFGYPYGVVIGDLRLYGYWSGVLHTWSLPVYSDAWQYPPAAALPIGLPGMAASYTLGFVLMILAVDLVAVVVLARLGGATGGGAWLWTVGLAALGPVVLARYDLVPAALALLALVHLTRAPRTSGTLAGAAAAMKLWPVVVLAGVRRPGARPTLIFFAISGLVVEVASALVFSGWSHIAGHSSGRRLEVESGPASLAIASRLVGSDVRVTFDHGAQELVFAHDAEVATICAVLAVIAACLVYVVSRRRKVSAGRSVIAVLTVLLLVSPVLSAQYVTWLVAVSAGAFVLDKRSDAVLGALVVGAAAATQIGFPFLWASVPELGGAFVSALWFRNLLLLAVLVVSLRRGGSTESAHALSAHVIADLPSDPVRAPTSEARHQ